MLKGTKVLEALQIVAPHLKELFGRDIMISVTDTDKFLTYVPGDHIDVHAQAGNRIPDSDTMRVAMAKKQTISGNIPKEAYGFAFKGICAPIFDDDGIKVIGCSGIGIAMDTELTVMNLADSLNISLSQAASAIQQIAASASNINVNEKKLHDNVSEVADASKQINEILNFIKNIADETKMLGLNAAIEAARAGDAGRGFGVVAEEIRKLSDQSKQTADQIRQLTKSIQVSVDQAEQGTSISLKASEEQAAATQEVTASIEELTSMATELERIAKTL